MAAIKGGHQPHIDDGEHKECSERLYADASVVEDQRGSDHLEAAPQKLVTGFHKYGGDELRSDRMIEKADQDLDCSRRKYPEQLDREPRRDHETDGDDQDDQCEGQHRARRHQRGGCTNAAHSGRVFRALSMTIR